MTTRAGPMPRSPREIDHKPLATTFVFIRVLVVEFTGLLLPVCSLAVLALRAWMWHQISGPSARGALQRFPGEYLPGLFGRGQRIYPCAHDTWGNLDWRLVSSGASVPALGPRRGVFNMADKGSDQG